MNTSRLANLILVVAFLATAAVAVVALRQVSELKTQLHEAKPVALVAGPKARDHSDGLLQLLQQQEAANAKLRAEIARLKKDLEASKRSDEPPEPPPAPERTGNSPWLDRLQKEDPERYKQIVEQREERRRATTQWYSDKINELTQRAQSTPLPEEAEVANQIADTLSKIDDLRAQWPAVRELPEDQRREATQQLQGETRRVYQALDQLRTTDRNLQFNNLFRQLGLSAGDMQSGVESINQILDSTRYTPPRMQRGGGFFEQAVDGAPGN